MLAKQKPLFQFKDIDDVLEENLKLKEEVQWLNDVITNNISDLTNNVSNLADLIASAWTVHSEDINFVRTEHSEDIDAVLSDIDNIKNNLVLDPVGNLYFLVQTCFYTDTL